MVEIFASLKLCLIQPDLLASEDSLGEVLLSAEEVLGGDNCLNLFLCLVENIAEICFLHLCSVWADFICFRRRKQND